MFSYGSGLSSTMFSFKIQDGQHPFSLSNIVNVMNISQKLELRHVVCHCIFYFAYKFIPNSQSFCYCINDFQMWWLNTTCSQPVSTSVNYQIRLSIFHLTKSGVQYPDFKLNLCPIMWMCRYVYDVICSHVTMHGHGISTQEIACIKHLHNRKFQR